MKNIFFAIRYVNPLFRIDMTVLIDSDWTTATKGVVIDYDLEEHPIQIKSDSVLGSSEMKSVMIPKKIG